MNQDWYRIVQLHIPKASGTTLHTMFRHLFEGVPGRRLRYEYYDDPRLARGACTPEVGRAATREALGDLAFDVCAAHLYLVPDDRVRWVSILRHPVDRIISNFYKIQRWVVERNRASVDIFFSRLVVTPTTTLSEFIGDAERFGPPQFFFDMSNRMSLDGSPESAIEVATQQRVLLGLMDDQARSRALFSRELGLPALVLDAPRNRGGYPGPTQEERDRVAAMVPDEIALYEVLHEIARRRLEGVTPPPAPSARAARPLSFLRRSTLRYALAHYERVILVGSDPRLDGLAQEITEAAPSLIMSRQRALGAADGRDGALILVDEQGAARALGVAGAEVDLARA